MALVGGASPILISVSWTRCWQCRCGNGYRVGSVTFTEDIAAIQAMFGSELSEATAGALAKPFEERVQDLAQSSNEIAQRYSAGTCM